MIILGIDPGSTRIGVGVVEFIKGKARCIYYGVIEHPSSDRGFALRHTEDEISRIIETYHPTAAATEKLFFAKNQTTVMAVSEFRGVILLTLAKHNLPVSEFTPMEVKRNIAGYGGAQKAQMQKIVQLILNLKEPIKPDDAADALALALCHSSSEKTTFPS